MKTLRMRVFIFTTLLVSISLLTGCGSQGPASTAPPTPSPTPSPIATSLPAGTPSGGQAILDAAGLDIVPTLADIAPSRTPEPTATPDALTEEVTNIIQNSGLEGKTLFWLSFADWINLAISLVFVLAGYLIGTWVTRWLLPRLVKRTKTKLDELLLQISGSQLRGLVVIIILRFAVKRLNFVNPGIKTFIGDISFFLIIFLISGLFWRLINLAAQQADARARKAGHEREADSLITLAAWGMRLIVIVIVIVLTLTHYGVNITGFAFILGVIVFAISLAGRDILTDIISGAMILIDRPFRIGDRLELPFINSWGDVVDIGMRSTKILSTENRMVVLPNSLISKNHVVNYSYPDPSYFNQINVLVAYDNDPDQVAQIIETAIRSVAGVQTEREVDAWLMEFTEYHLVFWAAWWVASYTDRYPVQNQVSRAIIRALKEAGVVLPYQKGSLDVQIDPDQPIDQRNPNSPLSPGSTNPKEKLP